MRLYLVLTVGVLVGCSKDVEGSNVGTERVALDSETFCEKAITTCGDTSLTPSECVTAFTAVRVSQECVDTIETATCSELMTTSVQSICFPACATEGTQSCNGDGTLTVCGESGAIVFDCSATCAAVAGGTWSGICGKSAGGETSDKDKCWCK